MSVVGRLRGWFWRRLGLASRDDVTALSGRVDQLIKDVRQLGARAEKRSVRELAGLAAAAERLETQLGTPTRGLDGRLRHIERNVSALIRRGYVDQDTLSFPHNVLSQRFHLWSQNEEDGITLALFKLVGAPHRTFVELGAGVNGGNCGMLAEVCGWRGLMVDGSDARADKLAARFGRFGVATAGTWITAEGVNELLTSHGMQGEIDLFSLDIDGSDYWVWKALDVVSPRVVIVEFNPAFGSKRAVTVQYDPAFDRARFKSLTPHFYGASLAAFVKLGASKGYRLVLVEPRGANAYFLRDDVAGEAIPALPAERAHTSPALDPGPLFDIIASEQLPMVDLDTSAG